MPPADSTPDGNLNSFELVYSVQALNKIPVHEFASTKTGLTVLIAEVDGPLVSGYFCLATETFDDDGLPHTLEHLIFLGSEEHPYKGVLDLLANRCLATGTNAWTDIDHTCYTMQTAGSEGFLSLMPIYLDHILYPILSNEGFVTEVHHITEEGNDAGVVYCEMQGRENSCESKVCLAMQRALYPGHCGYSSETGGIMKNLRESTTNEKVRNYHREFYRPENLKLIIAGQIKPEDVFRALQPIENKIIEKGTRGPFVRPWQNPVPPFTASQNLVVRFPCDEEDNGMVAVAWRGPSAVKEYYCLESCVMLLQYLTDNSVAPLQKEFVEIDDAYASSVGYSTYENAEAALYLSFENVPKEKLPLIKPKLDEVLTNIANKSDIDMKRMKSLINRKKLQYLSGLESSPANVITNLLIGHILYGTTKDDLTQRINPVAGLEKMFEEPQSYWLNLLKKYFVDNPVLTVEAVPSIEEKKKMALEEKERVENQIQALGKEGLGEKKKILEMAVEYNDRAVPDNMLTLVPIPSVKNIAFHEVTRYHTKSSDTKHINLSSTPVFTYFDHLKSSFVYMFAFMDTSEVPAELRTFLPLLLEVLMESPIDRDGKLISHEEVIAELQDDTIDTAETFGLSGFSCSRFHCGEYANTVAIALQVETGKFEKGITWLRELLFQTKLTTERIKIIATKIINDVADSKRSAATMISTIHRRLCYVSDSNQVATSVVEQHKFLSSLVQKLDSAEAIEVLTKMQQLRDLLTMPANICLYFAANLDQLNVDVKTIDKFLPSNQKTTARKSLNTMPDWKLIVPRSLDKLSHCLLGMGCLESSQFQQTTSSIKKYDDPDMPALLVFCEYLTQAEGPMWKKIRGQGYAYSYNLTLKINSGLLVLSLSRATNVVGAYKEAREIACGQIDGKVWDSTLLESAKSSLIYMFIKEEKSISSVVMNSIETYFYEVDYHYHRKLLDFITKVTVEDLNRVGTKYVAPLFDPNQSRTAVVCDPVKAEEIADAFKQYNIELKVYPSIEESFLLASESV